MIRKTKFSKLQLQTSKRETKQVSQFFSSNSENSSKLENIEATSSESNGSSSKEIEAKKLLNKDVILISDDEGCNDKTDSILENNEFKSATICNSTNQNVLLEKSEIESVKKNNSEKITKTSYGNSSTRKTTVSKFFETSLNEDAFEILKLKKVTNFKTKSPIKQKTKSPIKEKIKKSNCKRKKQTSIKSAFVKNEEIFSELMAQHSIAEDVNPDEMQMVLALSMSEADANFANDYQNDNTKDSLVCDSGSSNKIREKLQEYGFKTNSNSGDYDLTYFLPGKKKTKWANKFTPLTMRNFEKQQQKLNKNIENFLSLQFSQGTEHDEDFPYRLTISSPVLDTLQPDYDHTMPIQKSLVIDEQVNNTEVFYVMDLFEPSKAKPGNLLKSFENIPGRDVSPFKKNLKEICNSQIVENNKDNSFEEEILRHEVSSKYAIAQNDKDTEDENKLMEKSYACKDNEVSSPSCKKIKLDIEKSNDEIVDIYNKPESPDLFAESDADTSIETSKIEENSKNKTASSNSDIDFHITTYEQFTSDEVKVSENNDLDISDNINKTNYLITDDAIIDLTQEENNFHSTSINSKNKSNETETSSKHSRIEEESFSDCCIILSDDEVNYSINVTNKIKNYLKNKKMDTTLSTRSNSNSNSPNKTNIKKYNSEKCDQNISLIDLLDENQISYNYKNKFQSNQDISHLELIEEDIYSNFEQNSSPYNSNSSLNKSNSSLKKYQIFKSTESVNLEEFEEKKIMKNSNLNLNKSEARKSLTFNSVADNLLSNSYSADDTCFDLDKLRKEFGIPSSKKIKYSEESKLCQKSLSESFLQSPEQNIGFQKFSSCRKFNEFLSSESIDKDNDFSDFDEFDKLIYGSPQKKTVFSKPKNFDNLLVSKITNQPTTSSSTQPSNEEPIEFKNDGKVYLIRTKHIPNKPDYKRMDSPTRLKELYRYGLKPLKKKQAIIMLEYIYNQTHPLLVDDPTVCVENENSSNEKCVTETDMRSIKQKLENNEDLAIKTNTLVKYNNFNLRDCFGDEILNQYDTVFPENENESYIFQTNITKKISTALLPFHVAWYNLIQSHSTLRESILHYEPIDLQEIYLFMKKLGYRYDPKDMKKFFDHRCIIFRYDLSDGTHNRHVRKTKSKVFSQKC